LIGWDVRMMEGSTFITARERQIIEVNQKCEGSEVFWYELYIGEVK
jgi:hypothetical protein